MQNFLKKSAAVSAVTGLLLAQAAVLPAHAYDNIPDFSYLGAVGTFTAEQTQNIAEDIYQGLAAHKTYFQVGDGSQTYIHSNIEEIESVMKIYRGVISAWDVGILTSRMTIGYQVPKRGKIQITPSYLETDNYTPVYNGLMQELDAIVSGVDSGWSAAEKALYLHDYLAVHYDYDHEEYVTGSREEELQHTAYGMLKDEKAVCEGYAWLYGILLHRVGVDSMLVESIEIGHGWNLVYIDGKWYHVDVTWDDNRDTHPGLVRHVNFLKDNDTIKQNSHTSSDWVLTTGQSVYDLNVSDFYENGFWNDCNSAIQQYRGQWFAIHGDENTTAWFDLCDFDAGTCSTQITHLNSLDAKWARWYLFDKEGYYYTDTYVTPAVVGDTIYYTTPTSLFSLRDGQITWLLDLGSEQRQQGYIYGMYADGNRLYYYVSTAPGEISNEYFIELTEEQETTTTMSTTTETTTTTTSTTPETTTTTTSTTPETTTTTTSTTPETTTTTTSTTPETAATTENTTESETTPEETAPPVIIGNIDSDENISVEDVILVQKYLLGKKSLTEEEYLLADVTGDNIVNVFDYIVLKKMLLNP